MNVRNTIENLTQSLQSQSVAKPAAQQNVGQTAGQGTTTHLAQNATQDSAQVSTAAAQVSKASAVSDVRLDKVASIQSQLQAGTYNVPASAVAKKVVASMLDEGK